MPHNSVIVMNHKDPAAGVDTGQDRKRLVFGLELDARDAMGRIGSQALGRVKVHIKGSTVVGARVEEGLVHMNPGQGELPRAGRRGGARVREGKRRLGGRKGEKAGGERRWRDVR